MKTNPLVYVLAVGIGVVVLLMFSVNTDNDSLLPTPNTAPAQRPASGHLFEDRDNPAEAVKAVGSQINQLREEQSAFKKHINQTVEQLQRELQMLHSTIRKLANRQNTPVNQSDARQPENTQPTTDQKSNYSASGAEPIAPLYEAVPDPVPVIRTPPAWLWIEDQSVLTPDSDARLRHLADEWSNNLGIDAIRTIATIDDDTAARPLTIPPATVIKGVTLTATIGRLPVRGQLNEPWPVKVLSTIEGYAPNGYAVDAAQMIWDGKAFGDANFECVRVVLTRVTSVLPGAVISFVEATDNDKGLGYLSDAQGQPCLKGKLVSNAAKQMTAEAILGIAQGVGEGYADTQRTRTVSSEGNTVESVTGEEVRVLIGQGFAKSVNNVRNYLASRYDVWDAIYVPPEQAVVINVDQPLEFVYDEKRKLYDASSFAFKIGGDTSTRLD